MSPPSSYVPRTPKIILHRRRGDFLLLRSLSIFENRTQLPFPSANVQIIIVNLFSDDFFRETRTGQTHFFFSSGRGVDKKGDKGGIDDERDKEKKGLRSKRCCWGGDGKRRKDWSGFYSGGEGGKEAVAGSNNKRLVKDLPSIPFKKYI